MVKTGNFFSLLRLEKLLSAVAMLTDKRKIRLQGINLYRKHLMLQMLWLEMALLHAHASTLTYTNRYLHPVAARQNEKKVTLIDRSPYFLATLCELLMLTRRISISRLHKKLP
jgi:hypothetical protein